MMATLQQYVDKSNLTPQEEKALQELRENMSIIIKPADKGSATVIMYRTNYIQEALRQLKDTKYYVPLADPMFPETADMISKVLNTTIVFVQSHCCHQSGFLQQISKLL